jgi:hypothetical protein
MTPLLLDLAFELFPVPSMRFQSIAKTFRCSLRNGPQCLAAARHPQTLLHDVGSDVALA